MRKVAGLFLVLALMVPSVVSASTVQRQVDGKYQLRTTCVRDGDDITLSFHLESSAASVKPMRIRLTVDGKAAHFWRGPAPKGHGVYGFHETVTGYNGQDVVIEAGVGWSRWVAFRPDPDASFSIEARC